METREILWNVGPVTKVAMYTLFVVSHALLLWGLYRRYKLWMRGRAPFSPAASANGEASSPSPAGAERPARPTVSLERVVRHVFLQLRIAEIPGAWVSHMALFYGFIVLFIGTVIVAVQHYNVLAPFGVGYFFQGEFYRVTSWALDFFGVGFVLALVIAAARRIGFTPVRPSSRPVDAAILVLFLVIGLTGFLVEALRIIAHDFPEFERVDSFAGWWLANGLFGLGISAQSAPGWHLALWWVHMVSVFAFIALIPFNKLIHIALAPLNIAIAPARHSGHLPTISMEEVEATGTIGLAKIDEFSRQRLFSFDACTHCRRCESACPAFNTNKPLSPMRVILDIAEHAADTESLHERVISAETLWSCTTCGACVHNCPVLIDQMGTIIDMRRSLVGEGQIKGSTQAALRSIAAVGNPWGSPADDRMAWAEGLNVPTIEQNPTPDVLLWVGCAGSFDRRNQRVTRALVKILNAASVNFAVLGKRERCTGDPARRLGDEFTFQEQAMANIETLKLATFSRVVTACAHCFNTFKNEYPDFDGKYDVLHHTQLIGELLDQKRIQLSESKTEGPIALHDPCYLSRHNHLAAAPRRVLNEPMGGQLTIVEPEQHGNKTFCCGAGGGRMWMEEDIDKRVNLARWEQLKATGARTVATACPFCTIMLDDAAKADEASGVVVLDLAEIVADRLVTA